MEILTTSASFHGNALNGSQAAVDMEQIIVNTGVYQPAAGGHPHSPPPVKKPVDWAELEQELAAGLPRTEEVPQEEQAGWKNRRPTPDGEAIPVPVGALPPEDKAIPGEGKPVSRLDSRQGIPGRGAERDVPIPLPGGEDSRRVKAAAPQEAALPFVAKGADPKPADLPNTAVLSGGETDKNPFSDLIAAAIPANSRPAGEFLPGQLKMPDPLPNERQQTAPQFASEMKNHTGYRGGRLTYTFNKEKSSSDSTAVNQVQISFQGATVLTPSNRTTQENLLANQSEARGYLVMPAFDREQRQRQQHQDRQEGEDQ